MRLIDADALTEVIEDISWYNLYTGCMVNAAKDEVGAWCKAVDIIAVLNNAPTIEAEPIKHGRWDDDHKCTNCGSKALVEEKPDPYHPCHLLTLFYVDSAYCPNCGAKMGLEEGKEK